MKKLAIRSIILIILYVLLGNARSIEPNPFIPGATLAANMVVPVIAGILFGRYCGLIVGFLGTFLNALSPAGSAFEFAAIIPHSIMGFTAGYFKGPATLRAFSLLIGHFLNVASFILFGLLPFATITVACFWYGIAYESFIGILAIIILVNIYRLGFKK